MTSPASSSFSSFGPGAGGGGAASFVAENPAFDPEVAALIAAVRAQGLPAADPTTMPVEKARKLAERHHAFVGGRLPRIARAETLTLAGPAGDFDVRLVYPGPAVRLDAPVPVIVWLHGGGFVLNSIDTHERLFRLLALRSGAAVLGVGYSRAPERRFPVQAAETAAALQWLRAHGGLKGLDAGRIALGGDSAGANLALTAAAAEVAAGRRPAGLALFYGMYAPDFDTDSHRRFGDGRFGLSTERMRWYWSQYLGDASPRDPRAAPLYADLRGLPPTLLAAAGLDCLLDDSLCLAEALTEAGVDADLAVYPSLPHSFAMMTAWARTADGAVSRAAARLGSLLDAAVPPQGVSTTQRAF